MSVSEVTEEDVKHGVSSSLVLLIIHMSADKIPPIREQQFVREETWLLLRGTKPLTRQAMTAEVQHVR